jgi:hypothetical protein
LSRFKIAQPTSGNDDLPVILRTEKKTAR